jgi:hypothetical protein
MTTQTYPCYRCSGIGTISAFGHVLGGVCFKCGGSGKQSSRPITSINWTVLDANSKPLYNVRAKNEKQAVQRALAIFAEAQTSTSAGSVEFVAEHDTTVLTAVPASEYWTEERREAARNP